LRVADPTIYSRAGADFLIVHLSLEAKMRILIRAIRITTLILGLTAVAAIPSPANAQATGSVRGTVTDTAGGAPISNAHIVVAGTRLGAETGADGRYVIRAVPIGAQTINLTRLGYAPGSRGVTVTAGGEAVADFRVGKSAVQLDQVVTTATGAQRAVELGHAVSTVQTDSIIKTAPVRSISDMLNNRVAGAIINGQNGYTGTVAPIRLRGMNSVTVSNNPIIIVDGARIEATPSTIQTGQSQISSSRLGDLAMSEVESIEVVKGPAAATLYGTDAANGVIVIRTKRGQPGATRWQLSGEAGTIRAQLGNYDNYYGWGHNLKTGAVGQCLLINVAAGICASDSISKYSPVDDPNNTILAPGHRGQVSVQASGGAGRFRFMTSAQMENELGWLRMPTSEQARISAERGGAAIPDEQIRPNALQKQNFRVNLSTDLGSKADLSFSNGLIVESFRNINGNVVSAAYWGPGRNDSVSHGYNGSPVGNTFSVRAAEGVTRYISSLAGNYRPAGWLATRGSVGFDYSNNVGDNLQKNGEGPLGANRIGRRNQVDNVIGQYSADLGATVAPTGTLPWSLTSRTSVGAQYNRRTNVQTSATGVGLPPGSTTIAGAATVTATETHADQIVVGTFVDQQFGLHDRLFLTLGARADGASSFGSNLHTTVYPKVSASWLLSQESFFPKIPGVSSLRLRAALGESGVQPPSTAAVTTVTLGNAALNGTSVSAVTPGTWGNRDVKPERQRELEGGLDIEGLSGRLRFELTGYSRKSSDALLLAPFAASVGAGSAGAVGSAYANIGSVTNKGLEGLLNLQPISRDKISLDLTFSGSMNVNKLVAIGPNTAPGLLTIVGGSAINAFSGLRNRVGYPLLGSWQKPIISYKDANGDGILVPTELVVGDTEEYIGPSQPTRQLANSTTLSLWRDALRLSVLFDWRGGYKRYDYTGSGCFLFFECLAAIDKNSPLSDQARHIAFLSYSTSAGWFSSGDFTRLREASISAKLPARALRGIGTSEGTVTLAGQNLLVWSHYLGGDPEVNGGVVGTDINYTFPQAPAARYFIVRMNLSY
jgi:TonB-linked SusC/RagA family outer membrane protein